MKNSFFQSLMLFTLSLFVIGSSSCAVSRTSVEVLQPAEINFPSHIQSFVIVDRTAPSRPGLNILEGILTGESIGQDRKGAESAVVNLAEGISSSPRFSAKAAMVRLDGAPNTLLPWDQVKHICEQYDADALIVLEAIDSDVSSNTRITQRTEKKNGVELVYDFFDVDVDTEVAMTWRVYDPVEEFVADSETSRQRGSWDGDGRSLANAEDEIPSTTFMTAALSREAGLRYTQKIAPTYVQNSRLYFKKGEKNQAMKTAAKLAKNHRWDKASEIWLELSKSPNADLAGRASFNMALASEAMGDTEGAMHWVDNACDLLGSNRAYDYRNALLNRIEMDQRSSEQMARKK